MIKGASIHIIDTPGIKKDLHINVKEMATYARYFILSTFCFLSWAQMSLSCNCHSGFYKTAWQVMSQTCSGYFLLNFFLSFLPF
jgi:hypothetical protein